jgi:hypothetical protein
MFTSLACMISISIMFRKEKKRKERKGRKRREEKKALTSKIIFFMYFSLNYKNCGYGEKDKIQKEVYRSNLEQGLINYMTLVSINVYNVQFEQ